MQRTETYKTRSPATGFAFHGPGPGDGIGVAVALAQSVLGGPGVAIGLGLAAGVGVSAHAARGPADGYAMALGTFQAFSERPGVADGVAVAPAILATSAGYGPAIGIGLAAGVAVSSHEAAGPGDGYGVATGVGSTVVTSYSVIFNGSTDVLTASDTGFPSGSGARTIAFWQKTSTANQLSSWYGTAAGSHSLYFGNNDLGSGPQKAFVGDGRNVLGASETANGTWHHLAFTLSSGTWTVYVDGASDGSGSFTPSTTPGGAFTIGKDAGFGSNFTGKMTDYRVYDTNLSGSDITEIYNAGHIFQSAGAASANLKFWLPFLEGTGTAVADHGSLGNAGLLSGGTWSADVP